MQKVDCVCKVAGPGKSAPDQAWSEILVDVFGGEAAAEHQDYQMVEQLY
jgi:hypothetical protein